MDKTFEDFLQTKHAEQYHGTDDMMPDDYNDWICNQDVNDIIDWAEKFAKNRFLAGIESGKSYPYSLDN